MAPLKYIKNQIFFKIEETFHCLLKCYLCSLKLFGKFDLILAGLKKHFWLVKDLAGAGGSLTSSNDQINCAFFFSRLVPFLKNSQLYVCEMIACPCYESWPSTIDQFACAIAGSQAAGCRMCLSSVWGPEAC